jgi:pimeloyl-ACP methyl ester carboxylesterase
VTTPGLRLSPDLEADARRRVVVAPRGPLAVVELGKPTAPAWVVAHGAGSSAWFVADAFAAPVLAAGGRLVTYDVAGHGASRPAREVGDHHLDVHAEDLAAVVASVQGRVAVVGGVSLGAHAAVRAVATAQVAGAAVVACLPAWTGRAEVGEGPHAAVAAEVTDGGGHAVLARVREEADLPRWLREVLVRDHARHDEASLAAVLRSLDGGEAPSLVEVASLRVPLGVVGWPDDAAHPLAVAEAWAAAAVEGRLELLALGDLQGDLGALGRAAVRAVRRSGASG